MRNLAVLLVLILTAAVCPAKDVIRIEGSTTVGPIANAFRDYFVEKYPDVEITVNETGSGHGAKALVAGRCDIAIMSRFMKTDEFKQAVENGILPVAHVIAMDGIAVVVHPSNPVEGLTDAQVRDIYLGKITNWKELGGPDLKIVPISRDVGSGTYDTFNSFIMDEKNMSGSVEIVSTNPQAFANVKTTPGAIAYVGYGFVNRQVKPLKVNGIAPTMENILIGKYLISRPLFMFTNGYPDLGTMIQRFCALYLTEDGQMIIEEKGFVPVTQY